MRIRPSTARPLRLFGIALRDLKHEGTTRVNLAYYERKAGNPTLDFMHRCAGVLNMPVSEFIREDDGSERRKSGPKIQDRTTA